MWIYTPWGNHLRGKSFGKKIHLHSYLSSFFTDRLDREGMMRQGRVEGGEGGVRDMKIENMKE